MHKELSTSHLAVVEPERFQPQTLLDVFETTAAEARWATRLTTLHDSLVERAFELDTRGRADAADELSQAARQIRDLMADLAS